MSDIPLSQPDITEADIVAVTDAMRSGRLSLGPRQSRFEEMVAERASRAHGIAVNSGTSGLHLVLLALNIGPGDEVITTPFSFIASANCILHAGATPVFVDIDTKTLNMDPDRVEAAITSKTKAILGVEVFGNPAHIGKLEQIANRHEIPFIEDCCEAIGGRCHDRDVGSFGRAGVFAFYPNKQITTGEGGCIVTDDDHLAQACRSLRNQGRASMSGDPSPNADDADKAGNRTGAWLTHERLGYNYRMSEIQAALGISQMQRLDEILEKRRRVAASYTERLLDFEDLILPNIPSDQCDDMSWFVFVVRLTSQFGRANRDRIIEGMRRHEVGCSNYFPPIHLQPFYKSQFNYTQGDFPLTESVSTRTIALPFYNNLDEMSIDLVCQTLQVMIKREKLLLGPE